MTAQRRPDIAVSSIGDLSLVWVAPLKQGCWAWVEGELDYFTLEKFSGAVPDGVDIIIPQSGSPIAGAAGARWVRFSSTLGGGSLAFLNIAEMAVFPAAAFTKGATAEMLSLENVWNYDPTSSLAPDVSAGSPLGRTIVKANGPGNWLRDRQFCSLRWKEQVFWYLDPASSGGPASDENDGATALTPLFSHEELMDRIGGRAPFPGGYAIFVMSAVVTPVVIDLRTDFAYYFGALTPISFGASPSAAVTVSVDWNDATQTIGTIGVASVPVSWTASLMVGKLCIIQGGPRAGTSFWIMEDMGIVGGNPTARVSQPQASLFSPVAGTIVAGDEIQVYDLLQFGSSLKDISQGGAGQQIDFQYLSLGDPATHAVEIALGVSLIDSCLIHGLDSAGGAVIQAYNCQESLGCRAEQGATMWLYNGFSPTGAEARDNSTMTLVRWATYGTIQVAGKGRVNIDDASWVCSIGGGAPLGLAWSILPGGHVNAFSSPSRFWGDNVTNAFNVRAQGKVTIAHAKPPVFAGAAVEVALGNIANVTFAQLPYTNPIDQASFVEGDAPNAVEDQFLALAVDTGGMPAGPTVLLSLPFTVNGLRRTQVDITWSGQLGAGSTVFVRLGIDGVAVPSLTDVRGGGAYLGGFEGGSIRHAAAMADGAHTADIIVTVVGGFSIGAAPATNEGQATITVNELRG